MSAREFLSRARAEFVVRPDLQPGQVAGLDSVPAAFLPPAGADAFARNGQRLVPRLRGRIETHSARVEIEDRAGGGFRVERAGTSMALAVRLVGANDVPAEIADGYVVFRDGLGVGADVMVRASAEGVEDFVRFERRPRDESLVYDLELGEAIAGLRLVENALEVLDARGVPRMGIAPPAVVDASGTWHWAELTVERCAVDTSPVPPQRRPVTPAGASRCGIRVDWSGRDVDYPVLVDPNFWTNAASFTARYVHVATRIKDDNVLVAGGLNSSLVATKSAQVWDSATDSWSTTASMAYTRYSFAGLVTQPSVSTTVLVAGGWSTDCPQGPCNESERYNVSAGTWGNGATMAQGRANFGFSAVSNGTEMLASGGQQTGGGLSSAEVHTISSNTWAATASMSSVRYLHTSTALNSSAAVLVQGGWDGTTITGAAEKWSGGSWSSAGTGSARYAHTASLLPGDDVMHAGGVITTGGVCTSRVQVWTSSTTWSGVDPMTGGDRCFHRAATLSDGFVLIEGGLDAGGGSALNSATLFDTGPQTWSAMANMGTSRANHGATVFNTSAPSKVLITGGANGGGVVSACEYFTH